jgi:hypothetical protein
VGVVERTRNTDPTTSAEAVADTHLARSQSEVLAVFSIAAEDGKPSLADHDMVTFARHLGSTYSPQRLRSARKELTDRGLIVPLEGRYQPGPTHTRRAHVFALASLAA